MDILTPVLIWLIGWFITVLVIILVEPPEDKDTEVAGLVFLSLVGWPVLVILLFPVYFFTYVLRLRNRYL